MADHHADTPIDPDLAPTDPAEPAVGRPLGSVHYRPRAQSDVLLAIALGGMIGASARYGVARVLPAQPGRFPWATFWTNLSGSFALGLLLVVLLERFPATRRVRPFLATGIIGAFTTMSSYQVETAVLIKDGHAGTGVVYALGSLAGGLAVAYVGIILGRRTPPRAETAPS